jgi:DNA-binding response OmpR family regulator
VSEEGIERVRARGRTDSLSTAPENLSMATDKGTSCERRLLLVEGELRTADFLARGFSSLGIEVTVAEDDEVAGFLAATERFDAVVLDLGLSIASGRDLLRLLRVERPATPVIVLTASDEPESRRAILAVGASECITKPFALEDLRERVRACIGRAQAA